MGNSMNGKVVIITGGKRGIGKSMAELLAKEGAAVWVTTRGTQHPLPTECVKPGQIVVIQLDVTNERQVRNVFQLIISLHQRIDVLINNAGIGVFKPVVDTSLEEWNEVIQTNVTGVFLCSREAFFFMKEQGGGRIINLSSVAGYLPIPENGAYGTSKYAVRGFSEILNEEGKPWNIRVSIVSPGAVFTDMSKERPGFQQGDMLRPEDVAETILDIAKRPLHVRIDEVKLLPSRGIL
ncbi:SDR family oxidoreductase [Ammoniphilus resinae]|uniref:NAD(P)-dependent dehydrogenase (Short-subunit alcohol dehydrogenase family) n=1 Tax=Ammoniphilus resinae TaxID=861532 RepID=A0ABS4GKZ4_9BACL|nr:SDR family oxidoreductase [Ammoniphilus resinae]MBP1930930.1 NAD(P)-dependent dehydrogenase (short-subunit alcohol dehydrogenase family) [Ammoniphilus resinae]